MIDTEGKELPRRDYWRPLMPQRIPAWEAARRFLCFGQNFIGEPTAVLSRLADWPKDPATGQTAFGFFCGVQDRGVADMATWLELLRKGDCMALHEDLVGIRQHPLQNSNNMYIKAAEALDSFLYVAMSWFSRIFLRDRKDLAEACDMWLANSRFLLSIVEKGGGYGDDTIVSNLAPCSVVVGCVRHLQVLVGEKRYDEALSWMIGHLMERQNGVDKDRLAEICVRDAESGLWTRRYDER